MPTAMQSGQGSDVLRAFAFHGVRFRVGRKEATATCPFCDREEKLNVEVETGRWRCWVCGEGNDNDKGGGGNLATFLRCLWRRSFDATNGAGAKLAADRKYLFPETPMLWGLCLSITTRDWLVPAYSLDGKRLEQLYRWVKNEKGKMELRPTPGLGHRIFGTQHFDPKKSAVELCEGPWDGMAMWEVLRLTKRVGDELVETGNESSSLLSETNVLAVPGCGSIGTPFEKWTSLFAGKRLRMWFDSDHPKLLNGRLIAGAGVEASKRAVRILAAADPKPAEVSWCRWGEEGFGIDLPSGHDVRDHLARGAALPERIAVLPELLALQQPVPVEWVSDAPAASKPGQVKLMPIPCRSWSDLQNVWKKAMSNWVGSGLDRALLSCCACVLSTRTPDDPVWLKLIGPPGSGKTTICEALSVADKWVYPLSLMTGFHSGYKSDKEGAEDHGLIPKIRDKTLVIKDATILIDSMALKKTISEARDLFDGSSRSHYGHGVSRNYENIRATMILCGTKALYGADLAELGERFLTCTIMDKIDEVHEREICMRGAYGRARGMTENGQVTSKGNMRSREKTEAMRMTAGFVEHLREHDGKILHGIRFSHDDLEAVSDLGIFTAHMRARPSRRQDEEHDTRELASRVVSQLTGMAFCVAGVFGRKEIDQRSLAVVRATALDTSKGQTFNLVRLLSGPKVVEEGLLLGTMANLVNQNDDKLRGYLRFLRAIGVVEIHEVGVRRKWRLTGKIRELHERIKAQRN